MDKLSKEEVLHIADLANLELTDEEVEKYSFELKILFNEIDKVTNVNVNDADTMFSPSNQEMDMFFDEYVSYDNYKKLISDAPVSFENFIEVAGVLDE